MLSDSCWHLLVCEGSFKKREKKSVEFFSPLLCHPPHYARHKKRNFLQTFFYFSSFSRQQRHDDDEEKLMATPKQGEIYHRHKFSHLLSVCR